MNTAYETNLKPRERGGRRSSRAGIDQTASLFNDNLIKLESEAALERLRREQEDEERKYGRNEVTSSPKHIRRR